MKRRTAVTAALLALAGPGGARSLARSREAAAGGGADASAFVPVAGDPAAGWNFRSWGGAGRAANPDYRWRPGNDFGGDPPQEEQGPHSVFDSGASTLRLIRVSAQRLHALAPRQARQ